MTLILRALAFVLDVFVDIVAHGVGIVLDLWPAEPEPGIELVTRRPRSDADYGPRCRCVLDFPTGVHDKKGSPIAEAEDSDPALVARSDE